MEFLTHQQKINFILKTICDNYNITPSELINNKTRRDKFRWSRQIIEYTLFNLLNIKDAEIAKITKMSRTTVFNSRKRVQEQIDVNSKRGEDIDNILAFLKIRLNAPLNVSNTAMALIQVESTLQEFNTTMKNLIIEFKKTQELFFDIKKNIKFATDENKVDTGLDEIQ